MEVFGVPVNGPNVALTGAGLVAFWQFIGSRIPWGTLLHKLSMLVTRAKSEPSKTIYVSGFAAEPDVSEPGVEFMAAMHELHSLAHSPEEHKRLGEFTADWWASEQKQPAATVLPETAVTR